ncbi:MAG: glycosyltransferase family 2 protein, partial [Chryseobacterium sp.]
MSDYISVLLPTYNPDSAILNRALAALENQLLTADQWELIIIDNNSSAPISVSLAWHPNAKIIKEPRQGLSFARLRGFMEASGDLFVMVDDDNLLEPDYLEIILSKFRFNNRLGATGGKSTPLFEKTPPLWLREFYGNLALRDLGSKEVLAEWSGSFPEAAPIGAGMGIR